MIKYLCQTLKSALSYSPCQVKFVNPPSVNIPGLASSSVDPLSHPTDESVYYPREMTALERTGGWRKHCSLSAVGSHWSVCFVTAWLVQRKLDVEVGKHDFIGKRWAGYKKKLVTLSMTHWALLYYTYYYYFMN